MDDLAHRAARISARHPAPALPLGELVRLVGGSGPPVTDTVLLRTLAASGETVRIVEPARGLWKGLGGTVRPPWGPGPGDHVRSVGGPAPGAGKEDPGAELHRVWVVPAPGGRGWSPGPAAPVLDRMRASLVHLGWRVDVRSPAALARWIRLLAEAERVRTAVRRSPPRGEGPPRTRGAIRTTRARPRRGRAR